VSSEPELLAKSSRGRSPQEAAVQSPQGHPRRRSMDWGHIVRSVAIAIGITFVTAVVAYLALRFFASLI
jgi:hypothetical protein